MKSKKHFIQTLGCVTIASAFILSGCAVNSPQSSDSADAVVIAPAADTSSPTVPAIATAVSEETEVEIVPTLLEPEPELGSIASVLKKMETSPYTLYWRGKNTYSYYVGGALGAEYKPGESLVVKDESAGETSLTCKYDGAGALDGAAKDEKMKEACAKLMFTLDNELSD